MGKGRREAEKILLKIAKIAQALSQKQKRLLDPLKSASLWLTSSQNLC